MQRRGRHLICPSTFRRMLNMAADDQHQDGTISSEGGGGSWPLGSLDIRVKGEQLPSPLKSLFQIGKQ